MKKWDAYLDSLMVRGLIDHRKQAAVGNAKRLPNGEFGFVLMCLNGHSLDIYDTDFDQTVGDLLYSIDLTKVTNLKTSTFIFNSYIKFTYQNFRYKIINCVAKDLYTAVKSEVQ